MIAARLILLAAGGSLGLLLAAWGFQFIGGLAPCPLCLWQRWPHMAAVAIGAAALVVPGPGRGGLALAGAGATLTTAGIAAYHTGIERDWWAGPKSCTGAGQSLEGMSGADLLSLDAPAGIVLCDEVAWSLLGLSMASWNAIAALGLAALWVLAARAAVSEA